MSKNLIEILKEANTDVIDIGDSEIDLAVAFILPDEIKDSYDKFLYFLGENLEVKDYSLSGNNYAIVNMYSFVEKNINNFQELYKNQRLNTEDITELMFEAISGNAPDSLYDKFENLFIQEQIGIKVINKELVGGYNDTSIYNINVEINKKPLTITAEKHNYDMQRPTYKWEITEENIEITPEIKNVILFHLIEQEETPNFKTYTNMYKDNLAETRDWIKKFSNKGDINITLEDVGNIYSKRLANIMFELGCSSCHFEDLGSLEAMKAQMIHIVNQNGIMNQEDKNKLNDEIFNIIDVEKGLIYKPTNLIFTNNELRKNWEEELEYDLEPDEDLEDLKKKIPFQQWKQNLIDTGDYEETVYFNNDSMFTLQKMVESEEESEEDEL